MRHSLLIIYLVILVGCKANVKPEVKSKDYLTQWLELNEQNVYEELMWKAAADSANDPSFAGTEKAFFESDTTTYLGKFTFLARLYCDSIQTWYDYKITSNPDSPEFKIQLTINYNKKYIKAIDSLLTNFNSTEYFTIEKYEQPEILPDIYVFPNGKVIVKDIRAEISNSTPPYNIIFYVGQIKNKDFLNEIERSIPKSLLGEEIMLKKVGNIKFTDSASTLNNPLTITEFRKILAPN